METIEWTMEDGFINTECSSNNDLSQVIDKDADYKLSIQDGNFVIEKITEYHGK